MHRAEHYRCKRRQFALLVSFTSLVFLAAPRSLFACSCSNFAAECICSYDVAAVLEGTVFEVAQGDSIEAKMRIDAVIWPDDGPNAEIEARDDMPAVGGLVPIQHESRGGTRLEIGDMVLAVVFLEYSDTLTTTEFAPNLVDEDGTVSCENQPQVTLSLEEAETALLTSSEECSQLLEDNGFQENECSCNQKGPECSTVAPGAVGWRSLILLLLVLTALWTILRNRERFLRL